MRSHEAFRLWALGSRRESQKPTASSMRPCHHRDRVAQFSLIPTDDSRDLADDIRALFEELAATLRPDQRAYSGECRPALDVLETRTAIEIIVDMSGIAPEAVRVLYRAGVVIIAGEKGPTSAGADPDYHLVEREFGRFARVVRLSGAFDVQRALATIRQGELTIVLPKIEERRDRPHRVPVTSPETHQDAGGAGGPITRDAK